MVKKVDKGIKEIRGSKETFQEIGNLFRLPGAVKKVFLLKDGSLATTYRVDYDTKKSYLFQKMKIKKEELIDTMHNIDVFSSFLNARDITYLHFHHTNNKDNFIDYNGDCYRVRQFFKSYSYVRSDDLDSLYRLGRVIGGFQYLSEDFDPKQLYPVYPNIHNIDSIVDETADEYALKNKERALSIEKAYRDGLIPERVAHNDVRIKTISLNNSDVYYINIDFVRPGLWLYDFASVALMFCATTPFGESSAAKLDLEKLKAYLTSYIALIGKKLNKKEKELIPDSLFTIAIENIVVNKNREEQKNWCISIAKDIEARFDEIKALVAGVIKTTKPSRVNINASAVDRDINKAVDKQYKAGEYMSIHIPHFIKPRKGKFYVFNKRLFDIICSLLAIIVLSPLLLIVGLLVVATSKGPMIYVSKRVGKNGRIFNFYKFRSMYKDAEQRLNELLNHNEIDGGVTFKMKNDPRITPFGKFIRKTSIDELPQLFNILKGDMSIIGPRAALPREVVLYPEEALDRLQVPQGLSGEWQANGRSNTSFDNMIRMDLDYIQNKRGFWHDVGLVFKTIWVVITGKGAE